jgi:endonuclease/exonuclease/phosphatase (EEP) superfamily protein YafD
VNRRSAAAALPVPPWLAALRPWSARAGWIGCTILFGWSAVGWSARWWWLGEICVNFTFQLACGGIVAAALLWCGDRPRAAFACAALCAWHYWPVARLYLPTPPQPSLSAASSAPVSSSRPLSTSTATATEGATVSATATASASEGATASERVLRVAHANLLYHNRETHLLLPWLEHEDPDLVALLEYSPSWQRAIGAQLDARFPHHLVTPSFKDPWSPALYSLALYSKLPFTRGEIVATGASSQEFLDVELGLDGEPLRVLVLHPNRPGESARTATRNAVLAQAAARAPFGARSLVLADMNATAWSPAYADFVARTGLREAREGYGRLATWRSDRYIAGLWLDLDHLFVGAALDVQGLRRGPDIGSDHRPLIASFGLRSARAAGQP